MQVTVNVLPPPTVSAPRVRRPALVKEPERVRLVDSSGSAATVTARLLYTLGDLLT